jgi:L-noviosyl transferase
MRVLITTVPQVGHLFPMVPTAWALRCAGDEVLVTSPSEEFCDRIIGAGLPAAAVGGHSLGDYLRASVVTESADSIQDDIRASGRGWAALAVRTLPALRELVASYQPDLVISEPGEFAGRLAAASAGVPWLEHSWGLPAPPGFALGAAAELRTELPAPLAVVHPSPPSLWLEASHTGTAMRHIAYNGPARHRPRVPRAPGARRALVTFGSLLVRHGSDQVLGALRKLLAELANRGFELVLGLEPALVADLEPLPDEVVAAGWIPLGAALADCDLIVHHGGTGSTLAAAAAGVPQLVLPQSTDQYLTASVLAAYGSALEFRPEHAAAPATLGEAAVHLVEDPWHRTRADQLAAEIAALPGPVAVVERLRSLVRG